MFLKFKYYKLEFKTRPTLQQHKNLLVSSPEIKKDKQSYFCPLVDLSHGYPNDLTDETKYIFVPSTNGFPGNSCSPELQLSGMCL